ncbi:MAG: transporter [Verrucomicrobiales bacterium]
MRSLSLRHAFAATLLIGLATISSNAQQLEPRRWGHLPIGTSFAGVGYAYTSGDIAFNPLLRIEDAKLDLHTGAFRYIHAFELLERTMRIGLVQGYQQARWQGLLDGQAATVSRTGWSDTVLRLSTYLIGAPPLEGEEFKEYRKSVAGSETIVGMGIAVHLPTGHYQEDKLLNLGSNRFTIRPQLGVVHTRGRWSMELSGACWIFTDNDEFFGGKYLENDPLFTAQAHLVYNFRPGLWIGTGIGYGGGAQSTVDGFNNDDRRGNLMWGVSAGYPITPKFGIKAAYVGLRAQERVGADLDTVTVGFSYAW